MNRRTFIRNTLSLMAMGATNKSMAEQLNLLNNSIDTSRYSDYKTLICVFLTGGCDSIPLFIPNAARDYSEYRDIRQGLSFELRETIPLKPWNRNDIEISTPNFMNDFVDLFNKGELSFISNVGPLIEPTTKNMIQRGMANLPKFLSSHVDQRSLWECGTGALSIQSGWGGRMYELVRSNNEVVPANISLSQVEQFTTGELTPTFVVNNLQPEGLLGVATGFHGPKLDKYHAMLNKSDHSFFERVYKQTLDSALENNVSLATALSTTQHHDLSYDESTGHLRDLSEQLKVAARLVEIAPLIGQKRQILFARLYDFDTHDRQETVLPTLMQGLGKNISTFMTELELRGVSDNVVLFSQSDFGRTISTNGDGTDHGWGGHQFVVGKPVRGGQIAGQIPTLSINSPDEYQNMVIPSISIEQYASNISRWFGLTDNEIREVFPTLKNFDNVSFDIFN